MILIFLILSLCVPPFCFAQGINEPAQELSGFSLAQYEDGGKKKWKLNGRSAEVKDERVRIKEVSAIAFGDDMIFKLKAREGDFDRRKNLVHLKDDVTLKTTNGTRLTTDSLYWNTETRNVFTDDLVNIKRSDFEVDGKGASCDLGNKTAELKRDVVANIRSSDPDFLQTTNYESPLSEQGLGKGETTITCDGPLEIDYRKNKATFLNNVKIEDIQGTILSDRMDVYFSEDTRRVRCVVARGNVRILKGDNVSYSEKAIYLVDRGRVVLPKQSKLVIQDEAYGQ
jgi:LPS export ABC transporter protein LptC